MLFKHLTFHMQSDIKDIVFMASKTFSNQKGYIQMTSAENQWYLTHGTF